MVWTKGCWSSTEDNHPCLVPALSGTVLGLALRGAEGSFLLVPRMLNLCRCIASGDFPGKNVWGKGEVGDGRKMKEGAAPWVGNWTGVVGREVMGRRQQLEGVVGQLELWCGADGAILKRSCSRMCRKSWGTCEQATDLWDAGQPADPRGSETW